MKRVLTAAVLIPLVLLLIFKAPFWLITPVVAVVAELALWEYLTLADGFGAKTPRIAAMIAVGLVFLCVFYRPELLAQLLGAIALALLTLSAFRSPLHRALPDTAFSVFGVLYTGLSLATIPLISAQENGPSLLLFLFFVVWTGDIAALYVGRSLGKHKLAPAISPGKTWEGSIASIAGSVLIGVGLVYLAQALNARNLTFLSYPGSIFRWIFLAILLNVAAQVGDLIESAIKRGAGVKDSGTLLPGHGGILDRIDALLLAAPVLWYALLAQQTF
ncbi:phosphatidate cytidylyltransferase [Silvibacterium dinghuense]|uniref:Phosphatidate cytidylyltransferase n=1 Tax=Silvibacterium dinghuense TaxID=1560006 RepID=A0A4Q1SEL3_9BACT|nr:CDP-archaeol synthase [Silvibacterium dinghuense]RXS95567.1 CDP-archaeol synthase [Silvibacterium dinghuense]GGH14087.1 phosphatidate cytidylyltransferase [Silvibacterium dinghuense]